MKLNVKGLIFVGFAAAVFANAVQADDAKIVTSKKYVDAKVVDTALTDGDTDHAPSVNIVYDAVTGLQGQINNLDGTAYTQGDGITIANHQISNAGVRSIAPDNSTNTAAEGTITVNTNGTEAQVAVKGLAGAAYKPVDTAIDTSGGPTDNSNSVNLPTTAAVVDYVDSAIATQSSTDSGTYQVQSTDDYQMGNAQHGWTKMNQAQQDALNSGITSGTKVTHTSGAAAGSATQPVYVAADGTVTPTTHALDVMTGANGNDDGTEGLVPAPVATDNAKFLRGDGTWVEVDGATAYTQGTGIDINNHVISNTGILGVKANNTVLTPTDGVVNVPVMVGADGTNAGVAGLVPTSGATDGAKVLSAAGLWAVNHTTTVSESSTNGSIAVSLDGATATDVPVHGLQAAAYKPVDSDFSNTSSTNLPTTAAVAAYVGSATGGYVIPAAVSGTCTANAPCALVLAGDQPTWETIQQ